MTEPTTPAGRALLEEYWPERDDEFGIRASVAVGILAIEEQARAEGRREAVQVAEALERIAREGYERSKRPGDDAFVLAQMADNVARHGRSSDPTDKVWHNDGDECIGPGCINMEHDEAGRSSDPEPAPPSDARAAIQHALDALNEASDLAVWGDATESSLLEAHATLSTLLDRWADPALQATGEGETP